MTGADHTKRHEPDMRVIKDQETGIGSDWTCTSAQMNAVKCGHAVRKEVWTRMVGLPGCLIVLVQFYSYENTYFYLEFLL